MRPCEDSPVLVSVIVPTLHEVNNIDRLLSAILAEAGSDLDIEVLVADGGSMDGTVECVREWEAAARLRLIRSKGRKGLAGDVLNAARHAQGDVVVVMDADLSHPPSRIRDLVAPVLDDSYDMVVGSRYVPGGSTPDWPARRRVLSRLGGLLAWPLSELNDPMSGFFAVRKERLLAVDPEAAGFKIGLEVIAHGGGGLRVLEVPITFRDRVYGKSKIGMKQMAAYMRRLLVLAGGAISAGGAARFAAVGLIGMLVDLAAFELFFWLGAGLLTAHFSSFAVATISNYALNSRWAFAPRSGEPAPRAREHYARYLTVCLLALAIRGGVLAFTANMLGMAPQIAILFAIGAAAIVSYLGTAFFVFPSVNPRVPADIRWRVAAIGVVSYVLVLRLLFIGPADLIPQEAYYWNYAQHLDIGYLDHPPMVAWLIWIGTSLFGNIEFGVRIGAYASWLATGFFAFQLTRNLFGKSAAFASLLLVAALPFYFATGLLMTPDAPLTAAWAGALYFLERALVGENRRAWWGAGICIGLGLLSKYTIALLGPATLLFVLLDARSRIVLRRAEPYLAAALSLLIFSPVIYWNLQHDWASFAFQSARRIEDASRFSLPALVGSAILLISPLGLAAAGVALWSRRNIAKEPASRGARFMMVFTLVPLFVFVAFSLTHQVKLNWTGPLWLAVIPAVSAAIVAVAQGSGRFDLRARRLWVPTVACSLVFYGLGLNYLVLGLPGLGFVTALPNAPTAWHEFGREAEAIEQVVEASTGKEPLLVGLDTYNVASLLAFYGSEDGDAVANSVGRGILGQPSLMYGYWFRDRKLQDRPAILFAFKRYQIDNPELSSKFASLGDPVEQVVMKDGKPAGRFYYRVALGFKGEAGEGVTPTNAPTPGEAVEEKFFDARKPAADHQGVHASTDAPREALVIKASQ